MLFNKIFCYCGSSIFLYNFEKGEIAVANVSYNEVLELQRMTLNNIGLSKELESRSYFINKDYK